MHAEPNLLVEMRGVVKRYPLFTLNDLNLSLPEGQIMGLVGPNGAGKSTILKLLLGFAHPDAGKIQVLGHDIPREQVAVKQKAAYVSEEMRLYGERNIGWHLQLMAGFFKSWDAGYAAHVMRRFDLRPEQTIKHLSLGERIKTNLVLALARRPQLLVLDEPSTGLDPVARHELIAELFELMLDENNSVIFSSQYTQDVERLSDSIAFIDKGELISCQNKESYLDQWRRLELRRAPGTSLPEGLYCQSESDRHLSAIDTGFHKDRVQQLEQAGVEVIHQHIMTLEEIFIHQVLLRRNESAERKS